MMANSASDCALVRTRNSGANRSPRPAKKPSASRTKPRTLLEANRVVEGQMCCSREQVSNHRVGVIDEEQLDAANLGSPEYEVVEGVGFYGGAGLPVPQVVRPQADVAARPERQRYE